MKQKKLRNLKDGTFFSISKRATGATYRLERKGKGKAWFTSESSGRTFSKPLSALVYPEVKKEPGCL